MEESLSSKEELKTPEARYNAFIDAERNSLVDHGKKIKGTPRKWVETLGLALFSTLLVQGALRGEARADETDVQHQIIRLANSTGIDKPPLTEPNSSPFVVIEQALVDSLQNQVKRNMNDPETNESIGKNGAKKMSTPGFGGEVSLGAGAQLRVSVAKEKVDGETGVAAYSLFTFDI